MSFIILVISIIRIYNQISLCHKNIIKFIIIIINVININTINNHIKDIFVSKPNNGFYKNSNDNPPTAPI